MRAAALLALFLVASSNAFPADCVLVSSVCVDTTPVKNISGLDVTIAQAGGCWDYEDTYTCITPDTFSDCQPLRDRGCGQIGSTCIAANTYGDICTNYQQTFQCLMSPAQTEQVTDCSAKEFCMDGKCFDTGFTPDSDAMKVATAMEAAREAGLYMDPNSLEMFKGVAGSCAKGYFGLKNCCKSSGGAKSNNAIMSEMMGNVISNVAGYAGESVRKASPYMYDFMYSSGQPWLMEKAMAGYASLGGTILDDGQGIVGGIGSASFTPSFSMYGFTASFGPTDPSMLAAAFSSALPTAWVEAYNAATMTMDLGGGMALSFNPYAFAAQIAIQVIMDLMSCTQDEQTLGMRRGVNLCTFTGSYCSQEIPLLGICIETTESYCCFNSKLARIVNEQGRPQIGKSWGSGEAPNCSGFTPEQLQALDFSGMDLREFYSEIMANMKTPDINKAAAKAQDTVTNSLNYYYGR